MHIYATSDRSKPNILYWKLKSPRLPSLIIFYPKFMINCELARKFQVMQV